MSDYKFGNFSAIKIPPESTGPNVQSVLVHELEYTGATGAWILNDVITGSISNCQGTLIRHVDSGAGTGALLLLVDDSSPAIAYQVGETVTSSSGGSATIAVIEKAHTNTFVQVGGNNPYNSQNVDSQGSAYIRYAEGGQQLDAFGLSRFSTPTLMATFNFLYSEADPFMSNDTGGAGSVSHLPAEAAVLLDTGDNQAGSYAMKTTDQHYPYFPGVGRTLEMTVQHGDVGKENNVRRWGYFNDDCGIFFQLEGTQLSVVRRTKTSGVVVDNAINQVDWDEDTVDGSETTRNISNMNLDITKLNIYWIDLQWLGAGRVRVGVSGQDGSRILCHSFENANNFPTVYMQTASLPVRIENVNHTGTSASLSQLKLVCASIKNDGSDPTSSIFNTNKQFSYVGGANTGISTEQILFSLQSAPTFAGLTNRVVSILQSIYASVKSNGVIIRVYRGTALTGSPSWTSANPYAAIQVDTAATGFTGGVLVGTLFVGVGDQTLNDISPLRSYTKYDGSGIIYTITAEQVDTTATTNCRLGITWIERS